MIAPAVETLSRKVTRSLSQRGIARTARRCVAKPFELLWYRLRDLLPHERRFREQERDFDRQHHVDTCVQSDPGWMARIASPNWVHGVGYAPVPVEDMRRILANLPIEYEKFVFIDYGAGKGRALLLAAEFPFQRIIGVEYSARLVEVMRQNIASYRNPRQRSFELAGMLEDAAQYIPPVEPLVIFFHHPFDAPVFQQVLSRIEASLAEHPREMLVVYYDPHCATLLDGNQRFQVLKRGQRDSNVAASGNWVVYRALQFRPPH